MTKIYRNSLSGNPIGKYGKVSNPIYRDDNGDIAIRGADDMKFAYLKATSFADASLNDIYEFLMKVKETGEKELINKESGYTKDSAQQKMNEILGPYFVFLVNNLNKAGDLQNIKISDLAENSTFLKHGMIFALPKELELDFEEIYKKRNIQNSTDSTEKVANLYMLAANTQRMLEEGIKEGLRKFYNIKSISKFYQGLPFSISWGRWRELSEKEKSTVIEASINNLKDYFIANGFDEHESLTAARKIIQPDNSSYGEYRAPDINEVLFKNNWYSQSSWNTFGKKDQEFFNNRMVAINPITYNTRTGQIECQGHCIDEGEFGIIMGESSERPPNIEYNPLEAIRTNNDETNLQGENDKQPMITGEELGKQAEGEPVLTIDETARKIHILKEQIEKQGNPHQKNK